MALYLFEVHLSEGRSHKKYGKFNSNADQFNPVPIDFGGHSTHSIVSRHITAGDLHANLSHGFTTKEKQDLRVTEITSDTLGADGQHRGLREMVENCFLRNNRNGYPNISEIPDLDDE